MTLRRNPRVSCTHRKAAVVFLALLLPVSAWCQKHYVYVGRIEPDSFLLAWGKTEGRGNTIGRSSIPLGPATVVVAGREIRAEQNWVVVSGLLPDTEYRYEVKLGGPTIGSGAVRTYPKQSRKLAFFLMGDYGTGKHAQYETAEAMWREFALRARSDNPVRFVLTTGDNLYSGRVRGWLKADSPSQDREWGAKFFEPNHRLLARIPFYPTLGNHDADESLPSYLDNFFFPTPAPVRFYRFSFAGLADFFALDTTDKQGISATGRQFQWLQESLKQSEALWRIAYFHHPPFNAGPGHKAYQGSLRHLVRLFDQSGVQVVFSGHEHNFQYSTQDAETGQTLYVISGAGGQLRTGNIRRKLQRSHIAGWAAQYHFLVVEIEERTLRITPLGSKRVVVTDKNGRPVSMPLVVETARTRQESLSSAPRTAAP